MLRRELRDRSGPALLRFRAPAVHVPLALLACGWLAGLAWRGLRWVVRHPRSSVVLGVTGVLVVTNRVLPALVLAGIVAGALMLWWAVDPDRFGRLVVAPVQLRLREHVTYRREWQPAMVTAGLSFRESWGGNLPTLRAVTDVDGRDVLRVTMLAGQTLERWQAAAPQLAQTFGVRSVRVRRVPDRPREVLLVIVRGSSRIRHVTELLPVAEQQPATAARGAFPRQPRGGAA